MHWLDGISLDDNLISGPDNSGNNAGDSTANQRKSSIQSSTSAKAKRRRHAHYKLNSRLDRKSSRGMIYENEELRLRTININAEVERGQSDIKRLRRENEHLRREIWTLRDECDRLNKRFKAKLSEHDHGSGGCRGSACSYAGCNAKHCSGGGGGGGGRSSVGCDVNTDDSDSCDTCHGNDDGNCSDECCKDADGTGCSPVKVGLNEASTNVASKEGPPAPFDHLSVVSEETLSNLDQHSAQQHNDQHLLGYSLDKNGSQSTLPSLMGPITPLTPIELVANQLNDLQSVVPPLSYFENVLQQHMGSTIGTTPDSGNTSSTGTVKTVRHTNGWDYNLQSPFAYRKIPCNASPTRCASLQQQQQQQQQQPTLTTFVPTIAVPASLSASYVTHVPATTHNSSSSSLSLNVVSSAAAGAGSAPAIETVAITTNATQLLNSPKHFFAPIKPRLKLNTTLANRNIPTLGGVATEVPSQNIDAAAPTTHLHCDPPDIFVNNGLASPYQQRQILPSNSGNQAPPQQQQQLLLPYQVSPTRQHTGKQYCQKQQQQYRQHRHQHQPHQHQRQQYQCQLQQHMQQRELHAANIVNVAATIGLGIGGVGLGLNCSNADPDSDVSVVSIQYPVTSISTRKTSSSSLLHSNNNTLAPLASPTLSLQSHSSYFNNPCEPIYATAQIKRSKSTCISANALTKPLMTATVDTLKNSTATVTPGVQPAIDRPITGIQIATTIMSSPIVEHNDYESQTDSVNLQTILNDIESISEDLLAIQLEKNKSLDNLTTVKNDKDEQPIGLNKVKKPYRSEMNLFLNYDGTNTTITPAITAPSAGMGMPPTSTSTTSVPQGIESESRTRPCSLDRENTNSPSPHIPAPMEPFPDKCTYIGFDQINQAAGMTKPTRQPSDNVRNNSPPVPPARMCPAPANLEKFQNPQANSTPIHHNALQPNKSHLYKAIASAAAKRAMFRSAPTHLTKSLDVDLNEAPTLFEEKIGESVPHVDITYGDEVKVLQDAAATTPTTTANQSSILPTATVSCSDLSPSAVLSHLMGKKIKNISHSTPNSPHSFRRSSNSNSHAMPQQQAHNNITSVTSPPPVVPAPPMSSPPSAAQHRKESSDPAPMTATVSRTKCSRRHSDGTVHNLHRASNASTAVGSSTAGHHHHHNHHHQHSSSLVNTNPQHHSHHSRQDSYHAASVSDRNSNSFASSRDSSTTFSVRSNRRKISISSHTGGKIPWCGCWGNGCC